MNVVNLWLDRWKGARIPGVRAAGMAEATGANSRASIRIRGDVEHDIIGTFGIARHSTYSGKVVQAEIVSNPPGNIVVGTRRVATDADSTNHFLALPVECQSAAKDVDSSDFVADHRVLCGPIIRRRAGIRNFGIHGVAFLQSEETPAGLNCGIQVCCR